jgi:DNA repair exonuclease SbcCD ATPase subunit
MMRLRGLEVADLRKFEGAFRLDGLDDGVNVLCEANEFGKSTVLAAIKAALFERHNSTAASVRALRHSRNTTSPMVRLDFELESGPHRIEKRFLHRDAYARLQLPDGRRLEGEAAEESLQQILGLPGGISGGKQRKAVDAGVWNVLWVDQRGSLEQPGLSEAGRSSLHGCLEEELGGISGDDVGVKVQQDVLAALSVLLDGRDRPKGRYKEVAEAITAAEASVSALEARRAGLAGDIEELRRLRRELGRADDAEADARLRTDLAAARAKRDVVLGHAEVLARRRSERRSSELAVAEAAGETERRTARQRRIAEAERQVERDGAAERAAREEHAAAREALRTVRAAAETAEAAAVDATRVARRADSVVALVERAARLHRLETRLGRADAAEAEAHALKGVLAANAVDAARLEAIRAAEAAVTRARAALDAQAVEVELDLEDAAAGHVVLSGVPAAVGQTRVRLVDDTMLEIAGIGRIAIRPAIRDQAKLRAAIGTAEAGLAAALAAANVTDVVAAVARAAERTGVERALRAAEATLMAEAPAEDGLAGGVAALREQVAMLRATLQAAMAEARAAADVQALPSAADARAAAEAEAAARAAGDQERAARAAAEQARLLVAGPEAVLTRAASAQAGAETALQAARDMVARLRQEAGAAEAAEDDAALATRLAGLQALALAAADAVARVEREQPSESQEAADARIKRLEQAVHSREATLRSLQIDSARLSTRVAQAEGEGIDEQIAVARADLEASRLEFAELQREAACLVLLRNTLKAAESSVREHFVAPVVRRLTPYLQGLFPGVSVQCDGELQVSGLARQRGEESFALLSDGTREQVAVLLRLAYADLLIERGRPAMLILDDALAYSDADRLEQMFDLITAAARRMQVLMLTCRTEAFSRLGGQRVRLVAG